MLTLSSQKLNQTFTLWVVCLAIGLSNINVPLPVSVTKDLSVPFPCQSTGCGCKNAKQCWSSCCCHSDAQKLAWAKSRGVTPPSWFLEDLDSKPAAHTAESKSSCCCCAKTAPTKLDPAHQCCGNTSQEKTRTVTLVLQQQRGCNGFSDLGYTSEVTLALPAKQTVFRDVCWSDLLQVPQSLCSILNPLPELMPD